MATLAAIFRRPGAVLAGTAVRESDESVADLYRLRPLPWEDVYLYTKAVDNSRVVRQADPEARRRCVRAVPAALAVAVLIMLLLLPHGLTVFAGYQIHNLEREHERLANEKSTLELEEARLLSPERLQELARELELADPVPGRVMYLNTRNEQAMALNVAK
jgi:hypothetical protein